jgi:hypothetical protein
MWNNQNSGPPGGGRFQGLLDQIRSEYNVQFERAEAHDQQGKFCIDVSCCDTNGIIANNQVHEIQTIQRKLWEFEQAQAAMKKACVTPTRLSAICVLWNEMLTKD